MVRICTLHVCPSPHCPLPVYPSPLPASLTNLAVGVSSLFTHNIWGKGCFSNCVSVVGQRLWRWPTTDTQLDYYVRRHELSHVPPPPSADPPRSPSPIPNPGGGERMNRKAGEGRGGVLSGESRERGSEEEGSRTGSNWLAGCCVGCWGSTLPIPTLRMHPQVYLDLTL